MPLTGPNLLTVGRILLVPVLVVLLLEDSPGADYVAAAVFAIASATDVVDGWLARRTDSESQFGRLLDPVADKLMVGAALIALVILDRVPAWAAAIIIAREVLVTVYRMRYRRRGVVLSARGWGKAKTAIQIAAILAAIAMDPTPLWVDLLVYAAVAVTVVSAVDVVVAARREAAERRERRTAVPAGRA